MGHAAYLAVINLSGTPTTVTGGATTEIDDDTYQISDSNKRIFDRNSPVVVKDNSMPVDLADIESVNYFTGTVKLVDTYGPVTAITVDYKYIPTSEIGGAHSYELQIGGDVLDDSNFKDAHDNGPFRTKVYGITDVSFSISRWSDLGQTFQDLKRNREVVLIEIRPGGRADRAYMGWFVVESTGNAGDIGALEEESISFNLNGDAHASFAYVGEPSA